MSYGPNTVKCGECGVIITSEHTHDCKFCGCANGTMIDGGMDYQRIGGADMSKVLRWSKKRGWVSWTTIQAERKAREAKKDKPVKLVTISQKEYNELNYKLRHMVGVQMRITHLERLVRDAEFNYNMFEYINWRRAITDMKPMAAAHIEQCIADNRKLTGIKELIDTVLTLTKHPFGLVAAKAAYEEWEEYLNMPKGRHG